MIGINTRMSGQVVEGEVRHADTGEPLSGVQVLLLPDDQVTLTDQQGHFERQWREGIPRTLFLYKEGFQSLQEPVSLLVGDTLRNTWLLNPLRKDLQAIIVADESEQVYAMTRLRAVEGTAIYSGRKTEVVLLDQQIANLATNNARQIFHQVSGLNIFESDDGGSN